jgi:hypothetical protein
MQACSFQLDDAPLLEAFTCVCQGVAHMHRQSPPMAHRWGPCQRRALGPADRPASSSAAPCSRPVQGQTPPWPDCPAVTTPPTQPSPAQPSLAQPSPTQHNTQRPQGGERAAAGREPVGALRLWQHHHARPGVPDHAGDERGGGQHTADHHAGVQGARGGRGAAGADDAGADASA